MRLDGSKPHVVTDNPSAALLFGADTELPLRLEAGVYRRELGSADEVAAAMRWQAMRLQHVFLADELSSSIALDDLFRGRHGNMTFLGALEKEAKVSGEPHLCELLADCIAEFVRSSAVYIGCAVCAVPPSPEKSFDLPTKLAALISVRLGVEDISDRARLLRVKKPIKSLPFSHKQAALEDAQLNIARLPATPVVLIDDKYQSGTTANWVARGLRDAGATAVHGVFVVKTWRRWDNLAPPGNNPD